jgi:hypothetical protein
MRRIAGSLALIGAITLALFTAALAGAAVPIAAPSPLATATMSGDSTVVVTLSEPIASFPGPAVSGLTGVNGGHTIPC